MNDELTKFLIQIEELEPWKEIYKGINELYNDNILIKSGNEIASNKIIQLQSNWNSLRELIIKRLDKYDRLVSKEEGIEIETLMWVRDKMNELEGKDNNGIMD